MPVPISAYVLTCNNERTLEAALRCLAFVDELVVVDSGSTDGSLDIARAHADKLIERPWPGFRDQYQFAADQCTHDWRLFLDADEEVSPALAENLRQQLERNSQLAPAAQVRGYQVHRRSFYMGRWIRHGGWLPDSEVRLYHKDFGKWEGGLHAKIEVNGPVEDCPGFIHHFSYANISDQLQTVDRYSTAAAADADEAGKSFSLLHFLLGPQLRFIKEYFLKLGFLDGFPGLVIALNTMFYSYNKHAKLWERGHCREEDIKANKASPPES